MKYISYALIPISVAVLMPMVIGLVQKRIRKIEKRYNTNDFIICVPLFMGVIILVMTIVLTAILILLNIFDGTNAYTNVIGIPFLVFFYVGCYAIVREKIIIKGDRIQFTPFIGKTRSYSLQDIKKVKKNVSTNLTVYKAFSDKGNIMFSVSSNNMGFNLFIKLIQRHNIPVEEHKREI